MSNFILSSLDPWCNLFEVSASNDESWFKQTQDDISHLVVSFQFAWDVLSSLPLMFQRLVDVTFQLCSSYSLACLGDINISPFTRIRKHHFSCFQFVAFGSEKHNIMLWGPLMDFKVLVVCYKSKFYFAFRFNISIFKELFVSQASLLYVSATVFKFLYDPNFI